MECGRLFFFFYRFGAHRDLHSFPTRRSSDLSAPGGPRSAPLAGTGIAVAPPPGGDWPQWAHDPRQLGLADAALDRKSTRLNSSHTVISYAVFCLKKKMTPTTSG